MAQLSSADLRAALEFVAEAHSFDGIDAFRHGILPGLEHLVPCDLVGYNEVEPGGGALVVTHPEPLEETGAELGRLAHEHPLISVQMNGDNSTYMISDFLSARQFRALELYEVLYSQIGAKDQIAFGLSGPVVIGIAMNRDRRSFTERDRELLDLLRPHLAQAHARALERERSAALLAALEGGLAERGGAVVLVERGGAVAQLTGAALVLFDRYFPERRGAALPAAVAEWLEAPGRPAPLLVETPAGVLTVSAQQVGAATALVLDESPAITPERLAPLGLTRRQAEVLALFAGGADVGSLAGKLFISQATVRKHLEHIYARLGVHSRAEAIAVARAQ